MFETTLATLWFEDSGGSLAPPVPGKYIILAANRSPNITGELGSGFPDSPQNMRKSHQFGRNPSFCWGIRTNSIFTTIDLDDPSWLQTTNESV